MATPAKPPRQKKPKAPATGGVSIKNVDPATFVNVAKPAGATTNLPVMLRGQPTRQRTGTTFSVLPNKRLDFSAVENGRVWRASVDGSVPHPQHAPQRVILQAEGASGTLGAMPKSDPARDQNLIVKSGERPPANTLVYIHGIGNKPLASVLKCQWDTALFGVELGDRSRMALWVDTDRYPKPVDAKCGMPDGTVTEDDQAVTANILSLGPGAPPIEGMAREDEALERELRALAAGVPGRYETLRAIADRAARTPVELPADAQVSAQTAARVSTRVLPGRQRTRRVLAGILTRVFMRDVHDFLFKPEKRERMANALWDRLRGGGEPFVIVAHSLGSVVAYDLLRRLPAKSCKVALLVTIGSPLGIQEIIDHFTQDGEALGRPPCVEKWLNFADPLDAVAFGATLASSYGGVEQVEDKVEWGLNLDSPWDAHAATGYLGAEPVRTALRDLLGLSFAQSVGGELVSRDVVTNNEDADPFDLQDVLIQLDDPGGSGPPQSLRVVADQLVERLQCVTADRDPEMERCEPDRMRRFVQVRLTRSEIEALRTLSDELNIRQVWSNASKRALISQSVGTVQARPAHLGYDADGSGIGWAVLDTGINHRHPHFRLGEGSLVRAQWDCMAAGAPRPADGDPDKGVGDPNGHGTHVAGIIAGRTDTYLQGGQPVRLSGMAPRTTLYSFRTLNEDGRGSDASIIKALDRIAEINEGASKLVIHGVNLSLGSSFDPRIYGCCHTPLCQELRRLWRQGVLVVIAAGNGGFAELETAGGRVGANMDLSISDPANLEEAIAVGSVHKTNPHTFGVSYFSSRGPTADGRRKPDLVAPGEKILSAKSRLPDQPGTEVSDYYREDSGTSMAAPHVSGMLAAFLSVRKEFIGEPDRVKRILLDACTDLGRDPNMQGAGLVNLVKMLVAT